MRDVVTLGALLVLALSAPAHAGMPTITLSDIAAARLDSISFFLALLLLLSRPAQAVSPSVT